ncbi:MAG: alanine:cation symporter family protein [Muribaculaceae bacterium]|nr:alanine:cation symporter family protein [Muribaculaceae bacterium]
MDAIFASADYILIVTLLAAAVVFTIWTRGVQFRMFGEMLRLLVKSGSKDNDKRDNADSRHSISSFQAFAVSIASRVGTGNLAGVALAIVVGGPGSIFWMWVIALLGAATAFIESTLAQLYKVKGEKSFLGGPAYYILHGTGRRWWAITFAVLITLTFGIAFNAVQAQTIASAFTASFGIPVWVTGVALTALTLAIIFGGIQSIARFSQWVVPIMAIAYLLIAIVIICMNITQLPAIIRLIVENAFGASQALGGGLGMAIIYGVKRGLFSNEAGEGSTPNAAATASVSHPVKQGLVQSLGVFTDTLLICTATAFIILCAWSDGIVSGDGIVVTQSAIDLDFGLTNFGSGFISVAIFFFAFTSIVANYYYGETNLLFINHQINRRSGIDTVATRRQAKITIAIYRLIVGAIVMVGAVSSLDAVWAFADLTMAAMTICNLSALAVLGKYAVACLRDYRSQLRAGKDPVYHASTIPEIAPRTTCWY